MSYNVYKIEYVYPTAPNHYILFVETDHTGIGSLFHVKGNIHEGMEYEIRSGQNPRLYAHFSKTEFLGTVPYAKLPHLVDICESIPPPGIQLDDRDEKMFSDQPLYSCKEWLEDVIRDLEYHGVLEDMPQAQNPT